MRNWSSLTPNLSSWINAFLLAALLIIATSVIPVIHYFWTIAYVFFAWLIYFISIFFYLIINALPQFIQFIINAIFSSISSIISSLINLVSPFILLLPIPIIAFAHHYLYLLLDRYYPDLNPAERGRIRGYLPGIASWWHGLFALLIIILAMLISDSVLSIMPWLQFNLADANSLQMSDLEIYGGNRITTWVQIALIILRQPIYSPLMRLVIWVIAAAYIYQFEFIFRQHLISNSSARANGDRNSS